MRFKNLFAPGLSSNSKNQTCVQICLRTWNTGCSKKHVLYTLILACCVLIVLWTNLLDNGHTVFAVKTWESFNRLDEQFVAIPADIRHNWDESSNQALALYILSAIGSNTTEYVGYQRNIKLTGWLEPKHKKKRLKCCFLMNKTISEFYNPILTCQKGFKLIPSQFACPINEFSDIVGVDIQSAESKCSSNEKMYLKPYLPKKTVNEESFAVCLKLVYGNVDNKLFIDWIEFYREMKVDKIFMFTYKLTTTTNSIINHYVQLGLVERRPFDYPLKSSNRIGKKKESYYEDERVLAMDCLQRSSVYKYMSIIDMDEFLLPRQHSDFKEMMKHLMQLNPTAAGFGIRPYLFVKDLKPDTSAPINGSDIEKYFLRTRMLRGIRARHKNIILPSRICVNGYRTHEFVPSEGYESKNANTSVATINHYRKCYNDQKGSCSSLTTDKYILKFVDKFKNRRWYPDE